MQRWISFKLSCMQQRISFKLNEFKTNQVRKIWKKLTSSLCVKLWKLEKNIKVLNQKAAIQSFLFLKKKSFYLMYSRRGLTRPQIFGKDYLKLWKMCYDFGFLYIYLKVMFLPFQLLSQNRIDEEKSCKGDIEFFLVDPFNLCEKIVVWIK